MLDKFKIGDKVKFLGVDEGWSIPEFFTDDNGIPMSLIIHGTCILKKNKGTIVAIHKPYIIVRFIDQNGDKVQLGFKGKDLQLLPGKDSLQAAIEQIRKEIKNND